MTTVDDVRSLVCGAAGTRMAGDGRNGTRLRHPGLNLARPGPGKRCPPSAEPLQFVASRFPVDLPVGGKVKH